MTQSSSTNHKNRVKSKQTNKQTRSKIKCQGHGSETNHIFYSEPERSDLG